jgi:hypothetical protein
MPFNHGHYFFQVFRVRYFLPDIFKGKKFSADKPAKFFSKYFLPLWKDSMQGHTQNFFGQPWMKKHFYGNPVGKPTDKCRNNRDKK